MKCNDAQEYLSLKIDGVLPAEKAGKLEFHLKDCSECREFYDDLTLGIRMLAATEPALPDNFDWKLQLKLNQALKDAVGESAYPWEEKRPNRLSWFQNFGAAAAVGMAAVLALAIFAGPSIFSTGPTEILTLNTRPTVAAEVPWQSRGQYVSGDRRSLQPLLQNFAGAPGMGNQYSVSAGGSRRAGVGSYSWNKSLQKTNFYDQQTIKALRSQVQYQNRILYQYQQEMKSLRAHLDTTGNMGVDLHNEKPQGQD